MTSPTCVVIIEWLQVLGRELPL